MTAPLLRLKRRSEFLRVAASRRKFVAAGLILQALARPGEAEGAPIRVGFTASRKVGMAVERNRARRRLRAAVADVMPRLGRPGVDYVVIARAETVRRPYAALVKDLETALRRIEEGRRGARSRSEAEPA
jgi:ribonuclease P protein component